ncbi:hypothetical protein [Photobacterium kishitanii]|uniref:ParE family toxin-like protein n=1 Tax=Photobacterium kishitanii TaxID=318456 RepID=UPI00056C641D
MSKAINFTLYIDEQKLGNATPSLMCRINSRVWQNLSINQQSQTINLINKIGSGRSFPCLGGRKVKCNNSLVRFRIGRNHRLILVRTATNFVFQLFNRQNYEQNFKQKFSSLTVGC